MNIYEDQNGQFHNKPVTGSNPIPTNDGFIRTAYAQKVGLITWPSKLRSLFQLCLKEGKLFQRLPNKPEPPPSRDVVLGAFYLRLMKMEHMNGWNFSPYKLPKFSLIQLIKQAWALVIVQPYYKRILGVDVKLYHFELSHRNFFWNNSLSQIYHIAFSVPLQDRYSILKWSGRFKYYLPSHLLYASISLIDRLGKPSGIRYLKYGGEKNMRAMCKEFPADHPIRVKVGL